MPTNKLTHLTANNLVKVGRKARTGDGGGLWLDVRGEGRAAWVFRYTRQGKAREVGLGSQASVSLVQAREAAADGADRLTPPSRKPPTLPEIRRPRSPRQKPLRRGNAEKWVC